MVSLVAAVSVDFMHLPSGARLTQTTLEAVKHGTQKGAPQRSLLREAGLSSFSTRVSSRAVMDERWWSMKLVLQTLRSEATAQHVNKAAARQPTSTIVSLPVPTVWYGWVWRHFMRV